MLVWLVLASLLLVPVVFLASLLHSRLARGGLNVLFGELRTLRGVELQARLAQAVGDPSLVVAYERAGTYADSEGAPVSVSPADGRSVARIDGGALIDDSSLDQDLGLIEAISSATALALEHQRLLDDAQASRQRFIAAGDAERGGSSATSTTARSSGCSRVAMQLRLIQADIRSDPGAAEALATSASDELARSLDELRELARGIHPAVLEHGLAPAFTSLAARSPVPTAVSVDEVGEIPRAVELALLLRGLRGAGQRRKYAQATALGAAVADGLRSGDRDRRRRKRRGTRERRIGAARAAGSSRGALRRLS